VFWCCCRFQIRLFKAVPTLFKELFEPRKKNVGVKFNALGVTPSGHLKGRNLILVKQDFSCSRRVAQLLFDRCELI
jgi:hypothetical protein